MQEGESKVAGQSFRNLTCRIVFFRSFTDWPFTEAEGANCTAEKMAAAGFYLAPTDDEPDLARCFYCRQV